MSTTLEVVVTSRAVAAWAEASGVAPGDVSVAQWNAVLAALRAAHGDPDAPGWLRPGDAAVEAHAPREDGDGAVCVECGKAWPCWTVHLASMGRQRAHVNYVPWGGAGDGRLPITMDLGYSGTRVDALPRRGIRRAVWDACYGVVNGFPASAILWFVLTRSLAPRWAQDRIIRWETARRDARKTTEADR